MGLGSLIVNSQQSLITLGLRSPYLCKREPYYTPDTLLLHCGPNVVSLMVDGTKTSNFPDRNETKQ